MLNQRKKQLKLRNKMKKIYLLISLSIVFLSCKPEEHKVCGRTIEIYRTNAGYKSNPEAHVVFYSDSLQRNVDVEVSFNTYANIKVNQEVCFMLNEYDLKK